MKINPQKLIDKSVSRQINSTNHETKKIEHYPKISVIIPSYNQGKFLEETLLSVISQNYPSLELIIYDGGSTDESIDILKKYHDYIKYWISESDNGQADAINKGMRKSTGDLIGWLNSDDLYLPECLFKIASAFRESSSTDLFFGNCYLIDEHRNFTWELKYFPFSFDYLLYCGWNLSTQAAFWSRSIMEDVGEMKNINVAFDYDWFLRIADRSNQIHFINSALGCYRIHDASKFSMIKTEDRIPVYMNIRKNYIHSLKVETDFKNQFRLKRARLYIQKLFFYIFQNEFKYILTVLQNKLFS